MAALVRLLAPVGIAAPAVRTAVSRMVRQGWLRPVRLPEGAGYALTPRATRRLDDAAGRIYRTSGSQWDGSWHLAVTARADERSRRERLRAGLTFLGLAQLDETTWIGPRWSDEADALLEAEGVRAERFTARHDGDSFGLVRRAWDVEGLGRAYARWLRDARGLLEVAGPTPDDEQAFATRFQLVHGWRKFLFLDPGLPHELLPDDWPGIAAAEFFDAQSERLRPAASRYVLHCLRPD